LFVLWIAGGNLLTVWLNVMEFGDLFIRPFYFALSGGLILAVIALVRIDIRNRRSITWWLIRLTTSLLRVRKLEGIPVSYLDFNAFKLSPSKFGAWQITKVFLGTLFFMNVLFGMAIHALLQGWESSLDRVWGIFQLPFITPPFEGTYAVANVIPAIPALTLLISPILASIGVRLLILVGATQLARIMTPSGVELTDELSRPKVGWRLAILEALIALACFWLMFNAFFPSYINYNTKYFIAGLAAAGVYLTVSAVWDKIKNSAKGMEYLTLRRIATRLGPVVLIGLMVFSIAMINNSIADAKKVEWLGPYTAQEISVNRYLAMLDRVEDVPYNFSLARIPASEIENYVVNHRDLVKVARLWDWDAAYAKLKPEIGLIPYVDFQDSDILRFNGTLYWSSSMKPVLPETVLPEDRWYAMHFFYTHVPNGFFLLDAHEGKIVDTATFFNERRLYYGESGLFEDTWAAYPVGRERSDELRGVFYEGTGGLDISPPLSWLFEFNFLLAFPGQPVHVIRYRDLYDRMEMLFPYFQYDFEGKRVDMFPVTDGTRTYFAMPLIVRLDTGNVPWSGRNPLMRFLGYALIDVYDGKIQLLIIGNDFFSEMFKKAYSEYVTTEVPEWLKSQTRYPEEMIEWQVSMYEYYHVTDPATFIVGKEFFEVPEGLDTYFIMAQPPGLKEPEFIGLLSLELRGARGRNLAGYMIARNDYEHLGEMIFYEVPLEAETKLLGPTGVLEALEKNTDFAQLKTLLREPRIGNIILYRIGEHDIYFIPVYTAGAGGVVTETGVIAAVGATFTGEYFVGLGKTPEEAYRSFLATLAGVEVPPVVEEKDLEARKLDVIKLFEQNNLTVVEPAAISPDISFNEGKANYVSVNQWNATERLTISFIQRWCTGVSKVLMWSEDDSVVNFGVLIVEEGVVELHYITVSFK